MNSKAIIISSEICFYNNKIIKLNYPLRNSIRLSFWFPTYKGTTISEILISDQIIETGTKNKILVKVGFNELYELNSFLPNKKFYIGTFPSVVGVGKILYILPTA